MSQWRVRLALLALVLTFGVGLWVKREEVRVAMERRSGSEEAGAGGVGRGGGRRSKWDGRVEDGWVGGAGGTDAVGRPP